MKRKLCFAVTLVWALLLVVAVVSPMQVRQVLAGPLKAPTPIAATAGGEDWLMVTYLDYDGATYGTAGNTAHSPSYTVVDLQHDIDVADSQTVTCKLQWSNNNSTWDDGLNVFATKSADETDMQQYNMFGRYSRITCTLGTANPVTITIVGKLMR